MLTALLACCCLRDEDLPRFLKSFASTAVQRAPSNPSSTQPAPAPSRFLRLFRLLHRIFLPLYPPFLFFYMFTIVPTPPGPFRVTSAQLSPHVLLQQFFLFMSRWMVQFRNFSVNMFHAEAAVVVTLYVAVSLISAAAAATHEIVHPPPSSAGSSRINRSIVFVSSTVSLIIGSCLLLVIVTPFSWTVPLPLIPKQALQLHAITAPAHLSSSYGLPASCLILHFKLTLLRSVPFHDWRRQRPHVEVEWHGCARTACAAARTHPGGLACR